MENILMDSILQNSLLKIYGYLNQSFSKAEIVLISQELKKIVDFKEKEFVDSSIGYSYEDIQSFLASVNEKETIRKSNGVYYTSNDVVRFIYSNAIKSLYGNLKPSNLHVQDLNGIPYKSFCFGKTVFDPTCGAGEFLLVALSMKLDLLDLHQQKVSNLDICNVSKTIFGNDINPVSVAITKFRLLLFLVNRYGVEKIKGIADAFANNFGSYDFINLDDKYSNKYDIIIGNPPYVEDAKCDTEPLEKYGNVYANVLDNVSKCLNSNGVIGFIIPLSYVATPRMKKIRSKIMSSLNEQYVLSYCDRPDCLFPSVHQKLCILIGKHREGIKGKKVYTGNYQFWYKEERENLFSNVPSIKNNYIKDEYYPKIGTILDSTIYNKVIKNKKTLEDILSGNDSCVYLNMRAAFWIKAFTKKHTSGEYKEFYCFNNEESLMAMCLLNSSLFWWYWICVSDCWHITNKELRGFTVPKIENYDNFVKLAKKLENKLEKTKVYVGTKQTDYEYKHKECVKEIHEIDDYIAKLYGLTEEESVYIKNFAYRYRISGGAIDENN